MCHIFEVKTIPPLCSICGIRKVRFQNHGGKHYWKKRCATCDKKKYTPVEVKREIERKASRKYMDKFRESKLHPCEICGFVPKDSCQMDIHHKDVNPFNNALDNLQLLCSNCHRLVTKEGNHIGFGRKRKQPVNEELTCLR